MGKIGLDRVHGLCPCDRMNRESISSNSNVHGVIYWDKAVCVVGDWVGAFMYSTTYRF